MRVTIILIVLSISSIALRGQDVVSGSAISSGALVEMIIKKTGAEIVPNTVDVIKQGNQETTVTGIATCMFATMDVLKEAVQKNCNLIITHEPVFYNHLDGTEQFQNDPVYLAKKKFIDDNNLVVWRFHDYIHRIKPDGIIAGMAEKLRWEDHKVKGERFKFSFPKTTLTELLQQLKTTFPKSEFHVVGDSSMVVSNVAYVPGASGSAAHIRELRKNDIDVVVAGEVPQWETYEYVRDAVSQGWQKALILIGHINSEEAGMKFCADWLGDFIKEMPIYYIECGSSFWTY